MSSLTPDHVMHDPLTDVIPCGIRPCVTCEPHSRDMQDRLEGWYLPRFGHRLFWIIFIGNEPMVIAFKRQWAREMIRDLKVSWVHEQ